MPEANMAETFSDLAQRLAEQAEAVCRHYLSNGHREGHYWLVGDVHNTPGRSLYVRLSSGVSGKPAAGKFVDASTAEHGDLLDIIRSTCGFQNIRAAAEEARQFLRLPRDEPERRSGHFRFTAAQTGSPDAARRLFAMSKPITNTIAETYLRQRGLTVLRRTNALRFHPRCIYRSDGNSTAETFPALIAAVTDLDGKITGVQRTYITSSGLNPADIRKAPIATPRRAMGCLLGNAVRFDGDSASEVMAAGEGIETMLSIRMCLPAIPIAAALSAAHLAAIQFPPTLRRLYIACDNDTAGTTAAATLRARAEQSGIEAMVLRPMLGDFNDDLQTSGARAMRAALRVQLAPEDCARYLRR